MSSPAWRERERIHLSFAGEGSPTKCQDSWQTFEWAVDGGAVKPPSPTFVRMPSLLTVVYSSVLEWRGG